MRIRGRRECQDCGTRWSYFETGSVSCPSCGSMHSVGAGGRRRHTASPVELDLTDVVNSVETDSLETIAKRAATEAAQFVRKSGFIEAGEVQPLNETFVAAVELRLAGETLARSRRIDESERAYLLALLNGAESGTRPNPPEVPDSLWTVRGRTATTAVGAYRRDLRRYLTDHPDDRAREVLGLVEDHRTRIEALDGDVAPATAESLLGAGRAVGTYLINDDATLEPAREQLATVESLRSSSGQ